MRFFLLAAFLAVGASAQCIDTLKGMADYGTMLMAPTDAGLKAFCDGDKRTQFENTVANVLEQCKNNTDVQGIIPLFSMLKRSICQKDDENYCVLSLLKLVNPQYLLALINPETAGDAVLRLSDMFKPAILETVCQNKKCVKTMIKEAIKTAHQFAKANNWENTEAFAKFRSLAGDLSAACATTKDGKKCATKFSGEHTTPKKEDVCEDGSLTFCARKFLARFAAFNPTAQWIQGAESLCGEPKKRKMATAVLKLKNLLFEFYEKNKDLVLAAIQNDLAFNIDGLLGADISVEVKKSEDGKSVEVSVTINGEVKLEEDLDLETVLGALFPNGAVGFPNLDTLPDDSKVDAQVDIFDEATLEQITQIADENAPAPTAAPSDEDVSAANVAGAGVFALAFSGFVALLH